MALCLAGCHLSESAAGRADRAGGGDNRRRGQHRRPPRNHRSGDRPLGSGDLSRTEFLRSLRARGLGGVRLVISDAHTGLKAAIARVFEATWQRCRVHWIRNALAHISRGQHTVVAAAIRQAFDQPDRAHAGETWRKVSECWRGKDMQASTSCSLLAIGLEPCMDGSRVARGLLCSTTGRVRPCIRRLICGDPARPDERPPEARVPINGTRLRRSGPNGVSLPHVRQFAIISLCPRHLVQASSSGLQSYLLKPVSRLRPFSAWPRSPAPCDWPKRWLQP